MSQTHIQEQIELIARHEQEFLDKRTTSERFGDNIAGFAGSFKFVGLHLLIFAVWITLNTGHWLHIRHFDPRPFSLLSTVVAIEGLLLASFILMRQSRIGRRADEREHLMLQILLLTEREITAVLEVNRKIARQLGLDKIANDPELKELSQTTSIDHVAETIREAMPESIDP